MSGDKKSRSNRKRNWSEYNEELVKRGEVYLSLDFLKTWDKELEKMNRGKKGRPYKFPSQFILFTAILHAFFLPYRQIEGLLRQLSVYVRQLKVADYTTIFKRVTKLKIDLKDTIRLSNDPLVIAIDSTGYKVTNRGEWMREKWRKRRGWIKIHIAVNIETKEIIAIEITDERTADHEVFGKLIKQCEENVGEGKIKMVLADGAYDTKENFNLLESKGIESGIKIRANASTKARGSPYRARCVRERNKVGMNSWKRKYGYGYRWICESNFSSIKRIMGEHVNATKIENMFQEVYLKFLFYNLIINLQR